MARLFCISDEYWSLYFHRFRVFRSLRFACAPISLRILLWFWCPRKISLVHRPIDMRYNVNISQYKYLFRLCMFYFSFRSPKIKSFKYRELYNLLFGWNSRERHEFHCFRFLSTMRREANEKKEAILAFSYNHLTTARYRERKKKKMRYSIFFLLCCSWNRQYESASELPIEAVHPFFVSVFLFHSAHIYGFHYAEMPKNNLR